MPGEQTHEERGCPHPPDRSPGLEDRKDVAPRVSGASGTWMCRGRECVHGGTPERRPGYPGRGGPRRSRRCCCCHDWPLELQLRPPTPPAAAAVEVAIATEVAP